ncbi:hypothetical protein P8610_08645 [Fictibacillus sp. UD]|uniref:hypothetical protein n=1 Tax=Fictibacillus sp. UD TaxID=3038777 RepID=UPI0037477532
MARDDVKDMMYSANNNKPADPALTISLLEFIKSARAKKKLIEMKLAKSFSLAKTEVGIDFW